MVSKNRKSRGVGHHVNKTNSKLELEQTKVKFDEADFLPNLRESFEAFNSESINFGAKTASNIEDLCPKYFFKPCDLIVPLPTLVRRVKREYRYFAYDLDFRLINTLLGTHLYHISLDPKVASESNLTVTPHLLSLISQTDIKPLLLGVQLGIVGVWIPIEGTLDTELRLPKDARPHLNAMANSEERRQDWMVRVNKQVRIQIDLKDTVKPLRREFDPTTLPYVSHNGGIISLLDAAASHTNNRALNSKNLKDEMKRRRHGKKCICKDCRPAPEVETVKTKDAIVTSPVDNNAPEASTATPLTSTNTAIQPEEYDVADQSLIEGLQHMIKSRGGYTVSFVYAAYFLRLNHHVKLDAAKAIEIDLKSREKLLKSTGRVDYCDLKGLAPSHGLVMHQPYCLDEIIAFLEMEDADIIEFQKAVDADNLDCGLVKRIVEEEDENEAPISVDVMKQHLVNLLKNTYFRRNREYYYQRRLNCKYCLKMTEEEFKKEMRKQDAKIEKGMNYTDWSKTLKTFERYLKGKGIPDADVAAPDSGPVIEPAAECALTCEAHEDSSTKIPLKNLARFEELRKLGYGDILEQCTSLMERNNRLVAFEPNFSSIANQFENDIFAILDKGEMTEQHRTDLENSIKVFESMIKQFEGQAFGPIQKVKKVPKPKTMQSIAQQHQRDVADLVARYMAIGHDDEDEGESSKPSEPTKPKKSRKPRKPKV